MIWVRADGTGQPFEHNEIRNCRRTFVATLRNGTIPIGMAAAKGQPAFKGWLRVVTEAIKPEVNAEHARVLTAGE